MAKNIQKNMKRIQCVVCDTEHLIPKDATTETSFECEGCGNVIYFDENSEQSVFANPESAKDSLGDNAPNSSEDEKQPDNSPGESTELEEIEKEKTPGQDKQDSQSNGEDVSGNDYDLMGD